MLIIGDTGTGKEVAARALHDISGRATKPFVAINCAALPANLIESELFGHEAGAFPGAMRARYGKFEHARGGTVLLDEIGSMPLDLQARLLRVIQERVITRLGSNEAVPLDVRFIATSKADLEAEVAAGRFRADLLYRLNVVTLWLPALSARREDVPLLFLQLVNEAAARYRRDDVEVPPQIVADIAHRDWPGNVRELRNAADRFVLGLGLSPLEEAEDGTRHPPCRPRRRIRARCHCRCARRQRRQPQARLRIARHLAQDTLREDAEIRPGQAGHRGGLSGGIRLLGWNCTHVFSLMLRIPPIRQTEIAVTGPNTRRRNCNRLVRLV